MAKQKRGQRKKTSSLITRTKEKRVRSKSEKLANTAVENWKALGKDEEMLRNILKSSGAGDEYVNKLVRWYKEGKLPEKRLKEILTELNLNKGMRKEAMKRKQPEKESEKPKQEESLNQAGETKKKAKEEAEKRKEKLVVHEAHIVAPAENPYLDKFIVILIILSIVVGLLYGLFGGL